MTDTAVAMWECLWTVLMRGLINCLLAAPRACTCACPLQRVPQPGVPVSPPRPSSAMIHTSRDPSPRSSLSVTTIGCRAQIPQKWTLQTSYICKNSIQQVCVYSQPPPAPQKVNVQSKPLLWLVNTRWLDACPFEIPGLTEGAGNWTSALKSTWLCYL